MMKGLTRFGLALAGALALAACNPVEVLDDAGTEIERFHADLSAGNTEAMWQRTAPGLQEVTPHDAFVAVMTNNLQLMGAVQSTERNGFNINTENGVTTANITMETQFANGAGTETFVLQQDGERWLLLSYNLTSPVLAQAPAAPQPAEPAPAPAEEAAAPVMTAPVAAVDPAPAKPTGDGKPTGK